MATPFQGISIQPRLIECLRGYNASKFGSDLVAGITVGLVALPLAMAFGIASGVTPQVGLYTAVVAGFLISALGGTKTQIGGPTGAFVVIVAGIIAKYGLDGLYMCTLMAGVILVTLGIAGMGNAVKFIPRPVVIGFTNGIAVLIASTQIKDFLGIRMANPPADFLGRMVAIGHSIRLFTPDAALLGAGTLLTIILIASFAKKVPGAIVAMVAFTIVAVVMKLPIETIHSRFGELPSGFPAPRIPQFRPDLILTMLSPAITVAILGAVESLLSAVVADKMTGDKHNSNTELFAQGVANICCPLFGGLPATGAIARTATSIRSGAKTPVAGIVHAVTVLVILLVAAPLAKQIPLCVLSAILFMVCYNMGEWKEIPEVLKLSKSDVVVWVITFLLTVFADLTVAVEAGMVMAALLYIGKVSATTTVERITPKYVEEGRMHSLQSNPLPEGVAAFRIHGPFLFGTTDKLSVIEDNIADLPKIVMLRIRNMTAIDGTGLHALENLADKLHASGRDLVLCGVRDQPERLMRRAEFYEHVGVENIQPTVRDGITRAKELLERDAKFEPGHRG